MVLDVLLALVFYIRCDDRLVVSGSHSRDVVPLRPELTAPQELSHLAVVLGYFSADMLRHSAIVLYRVDRAASCAKLIQITGIGAWH